MFALGAGLAGLGGALSLPDGSANLQLDLATITDAFVVVVVGGLGSLPGAYCASLLIALLQAFGILLLPQATMVLTFVIMAVVLILRPNGLLGRPLAATRTEAATLTLIRPAVPVLRWFGVAILALAIFAPFLAGPFLLSVLTEMLIAMLFAASLHAMMGPGGMPSFGHAAFFGLGAYAAAFAVKVLTLSMPLALVLAPIGAALAAALFGGFVVRLSGVYLAMLTLAFAQIVWAVMFQAVSVTGGDNGILGVWPAPWAASPLVFYWLTLAICTAGTLLLRRILYAPFGYALRATRDSSLRAEAIGLHPATIRLTALILSGAAAGLAGGLTAFSKGSVFPTYISIGPLRRRPGHGPSRRRPDHGRPDRRRPGLHRPVRPAAAVHRPLAPGPGPGDHRPGPAVPPRHRRHHQPSLAARPRGMTVLDVAAISKRFGGVRAVESVSFRVEAGEMLALIGPNGAGKSTCFNMLNGQIPPDSGRITLNNRDITRLSPRRVWRLGVGRTFQITATLRLDDRARERPGCPLGPPSPDLALRPPRRHLVRSRGRRFAGPGRDAGPGRPSRRRPRLRRPENAWNSPSPSPTPRRCF